MDLYSSRRRLQAAVEAHRQTLAEVEAGDARLLRIALENLLRNAWKFTSRQEVPQIVFGRTDDS